MEVSMKKFIYLLFIGLIFLVSGCGLLKAAIPADEVSVQNACPVATNPAQEVYGIWVYEKDDPSGVIRNLLSISDSTVYLVEDEGDAANSYIRESFYEIQSTDWVNSVFTLKLKWVRVNGDYGGFESPLKYIKVAIDGVSMFYSMGDEGQGIPTNAEIGPFVRK
jgi:hypothetical protein